MRRKIAITAATYGVLALAGAMSFSLPQSLPIEGAMPGNLATGEPCSGTRLSSLIEPFSGTGVSPAIDSSASIAEAAEESTASDKPVLSDEGA